jgi:hypothetical protein
MDVMKYSIFLALDSEYYFLESCEVYCLEYSKPPWYFIFQDYYAAKELKIHNTEPVCVGINKIICLMFILITIGNNYHYMHHTIEHDLKIYINTIRSLLVER